MSPKRWIDKSGLERLRKTHPAGKHMHKRGAYVARAYLHLRAKGGLPPWAKRGKGRSWLFDEGRIISEAEARRAEAEKYMAVKEVGALLREKGLDVSKRTILNWFDKGVLKGKRVIEEGKSVRKIDRSHFERNLPALWDRLARADIVGSMTMHGKSVPKEVIDRLRAAKKTKEEGKRREREFRECHWSYGQFRKLLGFGGDVSLYAGIIKSVPSVRGGDGWYFPKDEGTIEAAQSYFAKKIKDKRRRKVVLRKLDKARLEVEGVRDKKGGSWLGCLMGAQDSFSKKDWLSRKDS